jgi:tetratricopeptide (TPR) repeat protein
MATAPPADRPPRWLPAAELTVLAVALLVRIWALGRFEATAMADHPMVDAYTYWDQAQQLFAGKDPFAREGYYQPPAYPWLLAQLGALTGEMSLGAVRRVQLVLGLVTTGLVLRLGRRVGGAWGVPWAGVIAGALFGLFPSVVMFEHDILTPATSLAALAGGLSLVAAWLDREHPGPRGLAVIGLAGLLLGAAAAIHPSLLLGVAVLGFAVVWRAWPDRALGPVVALAVGTAAPLAPTTLENLDRFGTPTLVSHNSGINLYLGNNASFRETMFLRPGLPFRQLALEAEPAERDLPTRNAWWKQRVREEAAEAPRVALAVLAVKALWSVNTTEIPRNEDYRCRTRPLAPLALLRWLPVRFGLVFPWALLGAVVVLRRREGARTWHAALPLAWLALHLPLIIFFPTDRYRLASWVVVAPLAALGVGALAHGPLRRSLPRWSWVLPVVGLGLAHLPIDQRTEMDPALCRYAEGNLAWMEQDWAAARLAYTDMIEAHPEDTGAHSWLARLAAREKDYTTAIKHMNIVVEQFPDHFPSLKSMADYHYYAGDKDGCVAWLKRAYAVPGDRTNTGVKLVKLLRRMGRRSEADRIQQADPKLRDHPKLSER